MVAYTTTSQGLCASSITPSPPWRLGLTPLSTSATCWQAYWTITSQRSFSRRTSTAPPPSWRLESTPSVTSAAYWQHIGTHTTNAWSRSYPTTSRYQSMVIPPRGLGSTPSPSIASHQRSSSRTRATPPPPRSSGPTDTWSGSTMRIGTKCSPSRQW